MPRMMIGRFARLHPWRVAAVVALLTTACRPDAPSRFEDPLGVGVPQALESVPQLVVGDAASGIEFFQVVSPFLMDDGRLIVPEAGARLRIFARDGSVLATLGASGNGPGEFLHMTGAWQRGDQIEVHDGRLRRLTRFLPDGEMEMVDLRHVPPMTPVLGALADGWVFSRIRGPAASGRDDHVLIRVAGDGTILGEILDGEGMERHFLPAVSGPGPLSPAFRVRVAGGTIYLAETGTPVIREFSAEGAPQREIAWDMNPTESPQVAHQAVLDSIEQRAPPAERESMMEMIADFPIGNQVPVFQDFLIDPEGFVWVQPFIPGQHSLALSWVGGPRRGGEWWILADDGTRVGSILIPEGFEVTWITREHVVGIHRDALGVESVRVYGLERS